jgi:hypothetical protein
MRSEAPGNSIFVLCVERAIWDKLNHEVDVFGEALVAVQIHGYASDDHVAHTGRLQYRENSLQLGHSFPSYAKASVH